MNCLLSAVIILISDIRIRRASIVEHALVAHARTIDCASITATKEGDSIYD